MSELDVKAENLEEVLKTPIIGVELSVRPRKALRRIGVTNLGDLVNLSPIDLLCTRNFGQTSLNEVRFRLSEYGLKLKNDSKEINYKSANSKESLRLERIKELAEQNLTRREIAEQLGLSYQYVCVLIKPTGIKVKRPESHRKTKVDSRIDSLISDGKTLQEMGGVFALTRQAIEQYLIRNGKHDSWRAVREKRKYEEKHSQILEEQRKSLIGGIISGVLKHISKDEKNEWAERKALEYIVSKNFKTNYSFDNLTKLFRIYEKAKEKGKKLSLEQLDEKTDIWYTQIGEIFQSVGVEPMYGNKIRRSLMSETELSAIKRAGEISIPNTDLAYFMNLKRHNLEQNFPRLNVKRPEIKKIIKKFRSFHSRDFQCLSFRLASQIYEAQDAGYFQEFSREQMAGLFDTSTKIIDYALSEERTIAPKIAEALKTIYPERKSKKPYKLSTDAL